MSKLRERFDSLENFKRLLTRKKKQQEHARRQYEECVKSLGKEICNQNTTFYLWAQILAKDIMSRPMV